MEHVLGVGGYFLRAQHPEALGAWYRRCLGIDADENGRWTPAPGPTVFATFALDTTYFGSRTQQTMLNFRVRDLDAMRAQLVAEGADVSAETEAVEGVGRFGWVTDPEGNRIELWQPSCRRRVRVPGMLPPGLFMLWEAVDPETALRERFGFEHLDACVAWVAAALEQTWGVAARGCSRVVISDQNVVGWVDSDRGRLIVKWSRAQDRFARLDASTRLLRAVAECGVPVAAPIPTLDGRDRATLAGPAGPLSVTVGPELSGDWLNVADAAAVHGAGAALAELHRALGSVRPDGWPWSMGTEAGADRCGWTDRIGRWLADEDRGFAPAASRQLADLLTGLPDLDDEPQLVHNDFRAANILVRGATVVGILDFDEVVVTHRVGDLAKASVYLGTRFTDWRPTPASARQTLRAGYESIRPLGRDEARWLEVLVRWQGLMAVPSRDDPAGWASAL